MRPVLTIAAQTHTTAVAIAGAASATGDSSHEGSGVFD